VLQPDIKLAVGRMAGLRGTVCMRHYLVRDRQSSLCVTSLLPWHVDD